MRADSKAVVLRFNEVVRSAVSEEALEGFFEVTTRINQLISEKRIYPIPEESTAGEHQ